jgi:hypothetical protein
MHATAKEGTFQDNRTKATSLLNLATLLGDDPTEQR